MDREMFHKKKLPIKALTVLNKNLTLMIKQLQPEEILMRKVMTCLKPKMIAAAPERYLLKSVYVSNHQVTPWLRSKIWSAPTVGRISRRTVVHHAPVLRKTESQRRLSHRARLPKGRKTRAVPRLPPLRQTVAVAVKNRRVERVQTTDKAEAIVAAVAGIRRTITTRLKILRPAPTPQSLRMYP